MGSTLDNDSLPAAKEALIFLLVFVTERWKIPIAYFLINGLNGDECANLLTCLCKLYEVGADRVRNI